MGFLFHLERNLPGPECELISGRGPPLTLQYLSTNICSAPPMPGKKAEEEPRVPNSILLASTKVPLLPSEAVCVWGHGSAWGGHA